ALCAARDEDTGVVLLGDFVDGAVDIIHADLAEIAVDLDRTVLRGDDVDLRAQQLQGEPRHEAFLLLEAVCSQRGYANMSHDSLLPRQETSVFPPSALRSGDVQQPDSRPPLSRGTMCSRLRPGLQQRAERLVAAWSRCSARAGVPGPLDQAVRRHVLQD